MTDYESVPGGAVQLCDERAGFFRRHDGNTDSGSFRERRRRLLCSLVFRDVDCRDGGILERGPNDSARKRPASERSGSVAIVAGDPFAASARSA